METKHLAVTRRFFKVMIPGFHHKLKLPPLICKELQKTKTQKAILQSRIGQWKIEMCRNCDEDDDELMYFKRGWSEFVDSHVLSIGDFLVFEHTGKLRFNVYVFDSSACEKEFGVELKKMKEKTTTATPRKRTRDDEIPFFVKKMTPFCATKGSKVNIPAEFVRSHNLQQKTSVVLRNSGGRKWRVKLMVEERKGSSVLRMCTGWHDFYASNNIKDGDVCVFKLAWCQKTRTNVVVFDVQITPA